jgi:hypothetical protein
MATPVWITLCKQANDLAGTTLGQNCPVAQRMQFQTTYEVLVTNLTTTTTSSFAAAPFDPTVASGIFGFGFGLVVFFYLLGLKGSVILSHFWGRRY